LHFNDFHIDHFGRVVGIRLIDAPVLHPVSVIAQSNRHQIQPFDVTISLILDHFLTSDGRRTLQFCDWLDVYVCPIAVHR